MDLLAIAFLAVFEGSLAAAGGLLLLTYMAFTRMNQDVRRARLFLMADRVHRFLGAFTFGVLLIAAASIMTVAGLPTAADVFAVVIFLFLAAIMYGSLELFLIIRPRRSVSLAGIRAIPRRGASGPAKAAPSDDPAEGDGHAAR